MTLVALGAADGRAAWTVTGAGRTLAVFVVQGHWYVTEARCPHNGGPLDQGWLRDGRVLTCPWHFYRFDLATGECQTTGGYQLACYPVLERDGEHYAEVPELPAPRSWSERLRAHARDGGRASGAQANGGRASGTQGSGGRASGTQGSGTQWSGTQGSGTQGSGTQGNGTQGNGA